MSVRKKGKKRVVKLSDKQSAAAIKRKALASAVQSKIIENPTISVGDAMREVGVSEFAATHPATLTKSKEWAELLDVYLPQGELLDTHKGLLRASSIDHMVFADGPRDEAAALTWINTKNAKTEGEYLFTRYDVLSDDDIRVMLAEKNCEVRRISRTENSRHVYFWSPDSRARKDALDMAYKLRGTYAAEKHLHVGFSLVGLGAEREAQNAQPQLDTQPSMREIE